MCELCKFLNSNIIFISTPLSSERTWVKDYFRYPDTKTPEVKTLRRCVTCKVYHEEGNCTIKLLESSNG